MAWARMAMTGGSYQAPVFCVAWPTGEFGGMGLEGSVRWATAASSRPRPTRRSRALFDKLLGALYAGGKAINVAAMLEIDAVIDPADTRDWIIRGLNASRDPPQAAPPLRGRLVNADLYALLPPAFRPDRSRPAFILADGS